MFFLGNKLYDRKEIYLTKYSHIRSKLKFFQNFLRSALMIANKLVATFIK